MRIFLAGGTQGACRPCAEVLLNRGHEVTVLVDTAEGCGAYQKLGVDVVRGSVFKLSSLEAGLAGQAVAVFFGADLPRVLPASAADLLQFDRLRREGARNLVAAVVRGRVPLLVLVSSVVVYGDRGEAPADESAAINPPPPAHSIGDMEEIARQGSEFQGLKHVVLRAGFFYSAHDWHTRSLFSLLKSGEMPPLGGEGSYVSPIHAGDLAEAVACAAEKAPAGLILNICDDRPVRLRDLIAEAASAMGVKPPGTLPSFLLRLYVGRDLYRLLRTSCRASNARAKELLGWRPRFPSAIDRLRDEIAIWRQVYREGVSEVDTR